MSTYIINLVEVFKKNKTDLKQLPAIIDLIINTKYKEEERKIASREINGIVSKIIGKIDRIKQGSTFKYLSNIILKMA
jgi:tRNA U34 5-carboxymethylaminomethyl modifying GTPase MnmE/TrmE